MRVVPASAETSLLILPLCWLSLCWLILPARAQSAAKPAPEKTLSASLIAETLDGKQVNLSAVDGWKVIYFWSSTCPCVKTCEALTFRPLSHKYGSQVHFYALVSGRYDLSQSDTSLKQAIQSRHLPFPVLRDPGGRIAQRLGAQVTPETYVIDPKGQVVYSGMPDDSKNYLSATGKQGSTRTYLAVALSQALSGQLISPHRTGTQGCVIGW